MKRIVFAASLFLATVSFHNSMGQDSIQQRQLSQLLAHYYHIKDALVGGNAGQAAVMAGEFIKTANSIDYKIISEGNINALLKDASIISEVKEIPAQRARFANLSNNMATLAKAMRLTEAPVYLQYCPMKKASWLSSAMAIENPYYGSSMLTCGEVVETIKH